MNIQHFRMAYHTPDLDKIIAFYTGLLELEVMGSFEDHEGFSGVFLGSGEHTWHLEFTTSEEAKRVDPSPEAIMVFYHDTPENYEERVRRFEGAGVPRVPSENPYWERWGRTYLDPDGHRIVLSKRKW